MASPLDPTRLQDKVRSAAMEASRGSHDNKFVSGSAKVTRWQAKKFLQWPCDSPFLRLGTKKVHYSRSLRHHVVIPKLDQLTNIRRLKQQVAGQAPF